jgi:hypothetical protein
VKRRVPWHQLSNLFGGYAATTALLNILHIPCAADPNVMNINAALAGIAAIWMCCKDIATRDHA